MKLCFAYVLPSFLLLVQINILNQFPYVKKLIHEHQEISNRKYQKIPHSDEKMTENKTDGQEVFLSEAVHEFQKYGKTTIMGGSQSRTGHTDIKSFVLSTMTYFLNIFLWYGYREETGRDGFYVVIDPYDEVGLHQSRLVKSIEELKEHLEQLHSSFEEEKKEITEKGKKLQHLDKMYQRSGEDCCICLEKLYNDTTVTTSCDHIFHIKCFSGVRKNECPLCRQTLD